jgi:hypothetical protein
LDQSSGGFLMIGLEQDIMTKQLSLVYKWHHKVQRCLCTLWRHLYTSKSWFVAVRGLLMTGLYQSSRGPSLALVIKIPLLITGAHELIMESRSLDDQWCAPVIKFSFLYGGE